MSDLYTRLLEKIKEHSEMDLDQIKDAAQHGADVGWPGFTYTLDCVDFYNANKEDIWELARDMADSMGHKSVPELVGTFARVDMADNADGFANLLAWFALEEVGRWADDQNLNDDEEETEEAEEEV